MSPTYPEPVIIVRKMTNHYVANESSQPATGHGHFIKSLIIGIIVVVLGLTTVLVCLRFSKINLLRAERVEVIPSKLIEQLHRIQWNDLPILKEPNVPDKINSTTEVQQEVQDVQEIPKIQEFQEVQEITKIQEIPKIQEFKEVQETQKIQEVQETPKIQEVQETPKIQEVQENVRELDKSLTKVQESEVSIEILKEVLGKMKEYISTDVGTREPFTETDVLENEMPTPRMIVLSEPSTETEEVFDDFDDMNVPRAFLGEESEEMSENPSLEEISTIVKKIIQSYKEKDDMKGVFDSDEKFEVIQNKPHLPYFDSRLDDDDDITEGTPSFLGEFGAVGTGHIVKNIDQNIFGEPIFRQEHPISIPATHNIHDRLQTIGFQTISFHKTDSNHDEAGGHFVLNGHRTDGPKFRDNIGDHVFPFRAADIHDDFAERRGMSRDNNNRHRNSRPPNSFHTNNSSIPFHSGDFVVGKLEDVGLVEDTHDFSKAVAEDVNGDVSEMPLEGSTTVGYPFGGLLNTTEFPLSETTNKIFEIESPLIETTSNVVTIEPILSETVDKDDTTDSPIFETFSTEGTPSNDIEMVTPQIDTTRGTEIASPPSETTITDLPIESPPIQPLTKSLQENPLSGKLLTSLHDKPSR